MHSEIVALIIVTLCTRLARPAEPLPGLSSDDYALISQENSILRIHLLNNVVEPLPVANLSSVRALEIDIVNNCVFWYDKGHNIICRQCLGGLSQPPEVLASVDIRSVLNLAFDWMSELLYFIDDDRQVIDVIQTSVRASAASNRWQRTIVSLGDYTLPRGLAVHPARGYLFWAEPLKIYRSDLDGANVRLIVSEQQLMLVQAVAIDYGSDRICWLDTYKMVVGGCDLDGRNCEVMASAELQYARAFALLKDYTFWTDSVRHSVWAAKKGNPMNTTTVLDGISSAGDLKIGSPSLQTGSNVCKHANNCSHICVGTPTGAYRCLCPQGMRMTATGQCFCPHSDDDKCMYFDRRCAADKFQCQMHGKCIEKHQKCDEQKDCSDGSDESETECPKDDCRPTDFRCDHRQCVAQQKRCDGTRDCQNDMDEANCTSDFVLTFN